MNRVQSHRVYCQRTNVTFCAVSIYFGLSSDRRFFILRTMIETHNEQQFFNPSALISYEAPSAHATNDSLLSER